MDPSIDLDANAVLCDFKVEDVLYEPTERNGCFKGRMGELRVQQDHRQDACCKKAVLQVLVCGQKARSRQARTDRM